MALQGLERLIRNNWKFTEPQSVKDTLEAYRITVNPIIQFLKDYLEPDDASIISVIELYNKYSEHCKSFGIQKVEASAFGRNVRKVYSSATQSPNALVIGKVRSRVWYGLRFKTSVSEDLTQQTQQTQQKAETLSIKASPLNSEEKP